ncbi:MAG: acyltransferase family protein [Frankiaceae bacterium]
MAAPVRGPIIFFDFARGVAAQAVVLGHALNMFVPGIFMVPGHPVFYMQSFAVIIFFVLSGYLITSALLKKKELPGYTFGSYLIDRIARVVYPLVPSLGLVIAFDFLVFHGSTKLPFDTVDLQPQTVAGNFLLLFNHPILQELAPRLGLPWISVGPVGSAAPLWSVVAEWWIYVAFGLLAFVAIRRMKLGVGGALLLVFSIAVPLGYMAKGDYESLGWIIGMLYALCTAQMRKLPGSLHGAVTMLATAGFLVSLWFSDQNLHTASAVGMASVAFCHLYFWIPGRQDSSGSVSKPGGSVMAAASARFNRISVFLSSFSYSLYLIHFSVLTYLWFYLHDHLRAWQLILLSFVIANAVAYVYFLLVERHFHKVGKVLKSRILR